MVDRSFNVSQNSLKLVTKIDNANIFQLLNGHVHFWWVSREDQSNIFLLFEIFSGTPPSCLKVGGWPTGF